MKILLLLLTLTIGITSLQAAKFRTVTEEVYGKSRYLFVIIEDKNGDLWSDMSEFTYKITKESEDTKMEHTTLLFYTKESMMPKKGQIKTDSHMQKVIMFSLQQEALGMFLIGMAETRKTATKEIIKYPIKEALGIR